MPTYTYHCKECDTVFETDQSMTDPKLETHTMNSDCGGELEFVFTPLQYNKLQGTIQIRTDRGPKGEVVAETTQHWDGRQDVRVVPQTVTTKTNIN